MKIFAAEIKWKGICLIYYVTILPITLVRCYDPCPEPYRKSAEDFPAYIPKNDIEEAFQIAEKIVANEIKQEKRLVYEGRVLNTKVKSPESLHPQAFIRPEVREKELRQRTFLEASILLTKRFELTPDEVSCILPRINLNSSHSATRAVLRCTDEESTIQCDPSFKYRTANGICNNLKNPMWGSALSCFNRLLPAVYSEYEEFRRSVTGKPLPPPRILSLAIHDHRNNLTNYINGLFTIFGQLIQYDFSSTAGSPTVGNKVIKCCPHKKDNHPQCAPILIPQNDPFYARHGVNCLSFVRSAICDYCKTGPRTPINELTAFLDASFLYGNSEEETDNLRDPELPGNLRVQETNVGDLPPMSDNPEKDMCSELDKNEICFQTGDIRTNFLPSLASLQAVFFREHNRVARRLRTENRKNCKWDEDRIFEEARKIVGAEIQAITYGEFLPIALGDEQMFSFGLRISSGIEPTEYNEKIDPGLFTEFSTAAFKFGHTLINSFIAKIPESNGNNGYSLKDAYSFPFPLYKGDMDNLLRGATRSPAQCFDRHVVPDVSKYLNRIRGKSSAGLDLPAFNIQRGRDHGLQRYVELIRYCSLGKTVIRSFDELHQLMSPENVELLRRNYRDVRDIDLVVGMLSEKWFPGAVIGPTAVCIIGMQFNRLKYGDRFYFEHDGVFTEDQRKELKKVTLARVICDNTGIEEIQENAMVFPSDDNPIRPCYDLPSMNLTAWKGT